MDAAKMVTAIMSLSDNGHATGRAETSMSMMLPTDRSLPLLPGTGRTTQWRYKFPPYISEMYSRPDFLGSDETAIGDDVRELHSLFSMLPGSLIWGFRYL